MGEGQSDLHGALLSVTNTPVGHLMRWTGRLYGPKSAHTHVYFVFFPSESSFWVWLTDHADAETAETPRTERTSETTSSFQQELLPRAV